MKSPETIYKEYMSHARHIEQHRLAFSTISSVIFGATLAYATRENGPGDNILIFLFLSVYSTFGYLITAISNAAFVRFTRLAESVAIDCLDLSEDHQRFTKHRKVLSAARIFIAFYCLMFGLSLSLIVDDISNFGRASMMIASATLLFVAYLCWIEREVNKIDTVHKSLRDKADLRDHG